MSTSNILLLGDSIRAGYQQYVVDGFQPQATVKSPKENCQTAAYTLQMLDKWLEDFGRLDVVHWNNGLHDTVHKPGRIPVPIDIYLSNLKQILSRLRETGTSIIWATTTPVHPDKPFVDTEASWRNKEIDQYNKASRHLMESEGISINDLHAIVVKNLDRYLCDDLLHLSEEAKKRCAEEVVKAVKDFL